MLTSNTESGCRSVQAHGKSNSVEQVQADSLIDTSSSTSARVQTANRHEQLLHTKRALQNTKRPVSDESKDNRFTRTSIKVSGGGKYGEKSYENGKEIVALNSDVLGSVSNATVVLVDGNELEREAVLDEFDQFLKHCPDDCISIMVPEMCSEMISWNIEMQMKVLGLLYGVVKMKTPTHVSHQIVYGALELSVKTQSKKMFEACGDIVTMILEQVHRYHILELVIPFVLNQSTCGTNLYRSFAARLMGHVGGGLSGDELWAILGDTIYDLAHDSDEDVRAMVDESMGVVGEKLSLDAVEQYVYPLLEKLCNDRERSVSVSSLRAIARTAVAHRSNSRKSFMYGGFFKDVLLKECGRYKGKGDRGVQTACGNTYAHLEKLAEVFGRLVYAVDEYLESEESWNVVLNTLRVMVTCNRPAVRRWCSYNMPAIVKVCAENAKINKLGGIISSLTRDIDVDTRATLAGGLHEITRSLYSSPLSEDILHVISTLCMDSSAKVQLNVISHLSELISLVSPGAQENHDRAKAELARRQAHLKGTMNLVEDGNLEEEDVSGFGLVFSSLELISLQSWRTQLLLAEQLGKCAHYIPQDILCDHIAPLLFQFARESTSIVRKASVEAIMFVIKYIPDVKMRNSVLEELKADWARGKKFWMRLAFIEGAELASRFYSHKLFRKMFKDVLVEMVYDVVPNVRHRVVRLLSGMVAIWKHDEEFRVAVVHLASDMDVEVSESAKATLEKMKTCTGPSMKDVRFNTEMELLEADFYLTEGCLNENAESKKSEGCDENRGNPSVSLVTEGMESSNLQPISASACDHEKHLINAEISGEEIPASSRCASFEAITAKGNGNDDSNIEGGSSVTSENPSCTKLKEDEERVEPQKRKRSIIKRIFSCCFRGGG